MLAVDAEKCCMSPAPASSAVEEFMHLTVCLAPIRRLKAIEDTSFAAVLWDDGELTCKKYVMKTDRFQRHRDDG